MSSFKSHKSCCWTYWIEDYSELYIFISFYSLCSLIDKHSINSTENRRFKGYHLEIIDTIKGSRIYCYNDTSQPYPALYQNNTCIGTGDVFRVVQTHGTIFGPLLGLCEVEVYGESHTLPYFKNLNSEHRFLPDSLSYILSNESVLPNWPSTNLPL